MDSERTLDRQYYQSEEIFAREKERIATCFMRPGSAWDARRLPSVGDFVVRAVAGDERAGRCRPGRAAAHLTSAATGAASWYPTATGAANCRRHPRCPYHSWTYSLEGALRTAPFLEEADGLAKSDLSLHPVAVDSWGGFIFLNLSPGEASRRGHTLTGTARRDPRRVRRYPLQELRVARRLTYQVQRTGR